MTTVIKDHEDLKAHVGKHLGYSDYLTVTQEQVQLFADATGDHQWIHLDVEKAKSGPFGHERSVRRVYRIRKQPQLLPFAISSGDNGVETRAQG